MAMKGGNPQNLRTPTTEQARIMGAKGGKASAESKKRKKKLAECLELLLNKEVGQNKDGSPILGVEAMASVAFKAAVEGDWKAWELVRDTAGQKPIDKVVVSDIDPNIIAEVEVMVNEEIEGD